MLADAVPGLTDEILDYTEGKRMVIVGGNWADPDDVKLIKKVFELEELEWIVGEKGSFKRSYRAASQIENGKFDIAVSFVMASSHEMYYITKNAAKKAEILFLTLNKSLTPQALLGLIGDYLKGRNRTATHAHKKV